MLSNREILRAREDLFATDAWSLLVSDFNEQYDILNDAMSITDEKTLYHRRGQLEILAQLINMQETNQITLEAIDT